VTLQQPVVRDAVPIFPLRTVLFPGGPLPLRIFEARYVDMVSRCLRQDTTFGVCLIREGSEVGEAATPHLLGTLAHIVDWEQGQDGLLGILALGTERFRISRTWLAPDRLRLAEVHVAPSAATAPLPPQPEDITMLLERIMAMSELGYDHCTRNDQDAEWLSGRLAEAMPITLGRKQQLLAMDNPMDRLLALRALLPQLCLP